MQLLVQTQIFWKGKKHSSRSLNCVVIFICIVYLYTGPIINFMCALCSGGSGREALEVCMMLDSQQEANIYILLLITWKGGIL